LGDSLSSGLRGNLGSSRSRLRGSKKSLLRPLGLCKGYRLLDELL
jgi:hypothetical protein